MNAPAWRLRVAGHLLALGVLCAARPVVAIEPEVAYSGNVELSVVPVPAHWQIGVGEVAAFDVRATCDGQPLKNAKIHYELGPEFMPPDKKVDAAFPPDGIRVESAPIKDPGFIALIVDIDYEGNTYHARGTVGVSPYKIEAAGENPTDFDEFWSAGKYQLASIPIDAHLTPMPERGGPGVDCYHVDFANVSSSPPPHQGPAPSPSRLFGVLCEPQGPGPFPAVLQVPGAGIRSYSGSPDFSRKGVITLQIGIHGIPVNLDPAAYAALGKGVLNSYPNIYSDNRDRYYYRRVFLGVVRANDFLVSRPRWDKRHLGVMGGSQGGALSIVAAGLDPRVRALVAFYPALSDHAAFLRGRAGGWPFLLRSEGQRTPERIHALAYYDVVNFARRIKAPGFYSWGFNDPTCPPSSTFAAYNQIPAPKQLLLALGTGHFSTVDQNDRSDAWMLKQLGVHDAAKTPPRQLLQRPAAIAAENPNMP